VKSATLSHRSAAGDPARLLQGADKFMRHVKLRPGTFPDAAALTKPIDAAYWDLNSRVENG
jgi:hypothetical protein